MFVYQASDCLAVSLVPWQLNHNHTQHSWHGKIIPSKDVALSTSYGHYCVHTVRLLCNFSILPLHHHAQVTLIVLQKQFQSRQPQQRCNANSEAGSGGLL